MMSADDHDRSLYEFGNPPQKGGWEVPIIPYRQEGLDELQRENKVDHEL